MPTTTRPSRRVSLAVAAQVEFENAHFETRIDVQGYCKGLKPVVAFKLWVQRVQLAPPHLAPSPAAALACVSMERCTLHLKGTF
jgi:hypothetical protein